MHIADPRLPFILSFLGEFESVDHSVLLDQLAIKNVPIKFENVTRALYFHTTGRLQGV